MFLQSGQEDENVTFLIGTCPDMCPAKERAMRARLGDLAPFERYGGDKHRTTSSLAVKKFSRTIVASETRPPDLRPLPVLQRTVRHLAGLLDDTWHSPAVRYDFFFDRSRAVRQELAMQRIRGLQAIPLYEAIVSRAPTPREPRCASTSSRQARSSPGGAAPGPPLSTRT